MGVSVQRLMEPCQKDRGTCLQGLPLAKWENIWVSKRMTVMDYNTHNFFKTHEFIVIIRQREGRESNEEECSVRKNMQRLVLKQKTMNRIILLLNKKIHV